MRFSAQCLMVAWCVVTLATTASAQGAPRTIINGVSPFTLGLSDAEALRANPSLHQTSASCPTPGSTVNSVPTTNYEAQMIAPLDGYPYLAHVVLCFYKGKLGAIHLEWSADVFQDSVIEWRSGALKLARQLTSAYAADLIKRNHIDESMGGRLEIRDAQGNTLMMVADSSAGGLDIMLDYSGTAYNQGLYGTASLGGSY
jgi:hypothetical protein